MPNFVDAAQRAKMIEDRISKNGPLAGDIPANAIKTADPNKRSEIQSRERGYVPAESNVNYGIRLSGEKTKSNIIGDTSSPKINASDFARELRLKREREYAQKRYQ